MNDGPSPEPVNNVANMNGILPGLGWPDNVIHDDDAFAQYFGDFIFPFDDDALLRSVVDQARGQWDDLFPDWDERDQVMFMAGVIALGLWWASMSVVTRNEENVPLDADEELLVNLDDVDSYIVQTMTRLVSTVHSFERRDDDDDWADIVERLGE